jgi:hypothetical protein
MSAACSEIIWPHGLLAELGFLQLDSTPICEAVDNRVVSLPHVSTNLLIADIFTKAMTRQHHQFLVGKLMILDRPASI